MSNSLLAQRLDHGIGVERARLLNRLRPHLDHGVPVQRETFGLISLRAEPWRRPAPPPHWPTRVGHRHEPHPRGGRTRHVQEILAIQDCRLPSS